MINNLIERYQQRRADLLPRLSEFNRRKQPYLIMQTVPMNVYQN